MVSLHHRRILSVLKPRRQKSHFILNMIFLGGTKIGKITTENFVKDGATLQLGIGAIPDSTLLAMKNHKDLGVHTELLGDGVVDLIKSGAINNSKKLVVPGKVVTSFAFGTQEFYKSLNENPMIHFDCCSWTNHSDVIRANSKMTCINSGIEIDITGQICSDSIGKAFYSGFGGQVDFMTAAQPPMMVRAKPLLLSHLGLTKENPRSQPHWRRVLEW